MLIFWHQNDLRIAENEGLKLAAEHNKKILPLYIYSENALGEASQWWLYHSLKALAADYKKIGMKLIIKKGKPAEVLASLVKELNAEGVYWNQCYSPAEKRVISALKEKAFPCNGNYLSDIPELLNKTGKPFAIFAPFYRAFLKEMKIVTGSPKKLEQGANISSDSIKLMTKKDWSAYWTPGRKGALKRLKAFNARGYKLNRDFPGIQGTSSLSPHLHFGEISPAEVWSAVSNEAFQRQLAWREFAAAFVFHFPETPKENWHSKFDHFPWEKSPDKLKRWKRGETGYPIVDAGMRQLLETGWMHNRVRMIVASFLVKDLFIHWTEGAAWFWETLVDADIGNNTLGWQWVAGSGPDAAPFFRIFNPVLQGEKFDPDGDYVKTYCPELKDLPKKWIHKPWLAPEEILEKSGIILGETYPHPIVDHQEAREKALKAFHKLK